MTIGELLERGYVKKVTVYTATEIEDEFIDVYKGSREQVPNAILGLQIKNWGIAKGGVDINVPLKNEDDIQYFLNALTKEEMHLRQKVRTATEGNKSCLEAEYKIVRKVLKNFAKNVNISHTDT